MSFFLSNPFVAAAAAGTVTDGDVFLINGETQPAAAVDKSGLFMFFINFPGIYHSAAWQSVAVEVFIFSISTVLQNHGVGGGVHVVKITESLVTPAFRIETCVDVRAGRDLNMLIAVFLLSDLNMHIIGKTGCRVLPIVLIQIGNRDRYRAGTILSFSPVMPALPIFIMVAA